MKYLIFLFLSFLIQLASAQEELTTADLKKQLNELTEKVQKLEQSPSKAEEKSKYSFFGDFRLRLQTDKTGSFDERRIQRFQLKLGAKIDFNEYIQAYARLMTGSGANSGNITMGDNKSPAYSRRSVGVDWAYINFQAFDFMSVQAGKLPAPFYFVGKNQLILDRDISPEGLSIKMPFEFSEQWSMTAIGLTSWAVEKYNSSAGKDETDSFFNGAQVFAKWKDSTTTIIAGAGSFAFTKIKDKEPKEFLGNSTDNESRGNTLELDGFGVSKYIYNYDLTEIFVEVKYKIKDWELSVFQEQVENANAKYQKKANALGVSANYKKWTVSYADQKVERDSVFGLFTDSDFANNTTAAKGIILQVNYKIAKDMAFALTEFNNRTNIDTAFPVKYKRTHLDFTVSF